MNVFRLLRGVGFPEHWQERSPIWGWRVGEHVVHNHGTTTGILIARPSFQEVVVFSSGGFRLWRSSKGMFSSGRCEHKGLNGSRTTKQWSA